MQEMTSSICDSIVTDTEGRLIDVRDNNIYHVGKMKDGKCWMLQNLALGSTSSAIPLTPADSNVASDWSLPMSYATAESGSTSTTAIQSWNFGKWVLATPLLTTSCGDSGSIPSLSSCTKVGFVDVSDTTNFQPTYTATTGDWDGLNAADDTLVAVDCIAWSGSGTSRTCASGTYDAHYLVGNYYSWNAATAGTGGTIKGGEASGSICPKGWRLPMRNPTVIGSFTGLLNQYGVSSSLSGTVNGITYNIAGEPLRFVRGGSVNSGRYINVAGSYGYYWTSTAWGNTTDAYWQSFDGSKVIGSASNGSRYPGLSVRCVSQ